MKTLIIYESYHHGNTKKVAEAIAGMLDAKLATPSEVDVNALGEYDLIGFGSGIYYGRYHENVLALIDRLPSMNKKAFLFCTCGLERGERYTTGISNKLEKKGFTIVGKFSCAGWDTSPAVAWMGGIKKGRPNEADLEKAKDFAKGLKGQT
ncbi:MAG: flavodoxin family protein [Candidatus Freyarchaeum deiterrae]